MLNLTSGRAYNDHMQTPLMIVTVKWQVQRFIVQLNRREVAAFEPCRCYLDYKSLFRWSDYCWLWSCGIRCGSFNFFLGLFDFLLWRVRFG